MVSPHSRIPLKGHSHATMHPRKEMKGKVDLDCAPIGASFPLDLSLNFLTEVQLGESEKILIKTENSKTKSQDRTKET